MQSEEKKRKEKAAVEVMEQQPAAAKKGRRAKPRSIRNPTYVTRLANLKEIVKGPRFKGNAAACARALGRSHNFLWQLLKGYRAVGEGSARLIEKKLGLGAGTLDKKSGDAFERTTVLTAQLGQGSALTIVLVPVVSMLDALGSDAGRRKAMSRATQFIPLPVMESSVEKLPANAYGLVVDFATMSPRMLKGLDEIVVDPDDKEVQDNRIYYLLVKATQEGVVRVAVRRESKGFAFMCPPEAIPPHPEPPLFRAEVEILGRVVRITRTV